MSNRTTWAARHPRLRLAEGVVKAVFTTSPKETTEVVVRRNGDVVVRPASKQTVSHA